MRTGAVSTSVGGGSGSRLSLVSGGLPSFHFKLCCVGESAEYGFHCTACYLTHLLTSAVSSGARSAGLGRVSSFPVASSARRSGKVYAEEVRSCEYHFGHD